MYLSSTFIVIYKKVGYTESYTLFTYVTNIRFYFHSISDLPAISAGPVRQEAFLKLHDHEYTPDYPITFRPMGEISGFPVRPGMFDVNGALPLPCGVNFTIHTHGGTSCELLLFHRGEEEPYAVLPFPESYKIGDVYSMIVYGLNIREFEYAYRVDGPYDPARGLLFNKARSIRKSCHRSEYLGR